MADMARVDIERIPTAFVLAIQVYACMEQTVINYYIISRTRLC